MIYSYTLSRGCFWFTFKGIQKGIDFVKHFANKKCFGHSSVTDLVVIKGPIVSCFTTQTYFIHIKKHVIQLRTA